MRWYYLETHVWFGWGANSLLIYFTEINSFKDQNSVTREQQETNCDKDLRKCFNETHLSLTLTCYLATAQIEGWLVQWLVQGWLVQGWLLHLMCDSAMSSVLIILL